MNIILFQYFKTPFGELKIASYDGRLCMCDWRYRKMREQIDQRINQKLGTEFKERTSDIIEETKRQLNEYFARKRRDFDIPLQFVGSDFQQRVWKELLNIPYGQTETYLGLSSRLGDIKAIRAVATANGANALSIIVPCHRIIGSDGKLIGYAGGLITKHKLLELENEQRKELLLFDE